MDRLREMEVLVTVADLGSFAKAADRLRMSAPAVTRAVASLEERLGVRLFNRTTRRLGLTEAGARFLFSARRLLADLDTVEKDAAGEAVTPQGQLAVTASMTFGRSVLTPIVASFLAQHERINVSLMLIDRVVNLVEEGIDVGVRIGNLPDSSLLARRIGAVRRIAVASPAYIEKCGIPASPESLRDHTVIGFTSVMPNREWRYQIEGKPGQITLVPRIEVNDALAALECAKAGEGITSLLSYIAAEPIRAGALVPILEDYALPSVPVHLVYPQSRQVLPKTRAFLDFAAPRLRARLETVWMAPAADPTTS